MGGPQVLCPRCTTLCPLDDVKADRLTEGAALCSGCRDDLARQVYRSETWTMDSTIPARRQKAPRKHRRKGT